ncbi:hypothetical protein ACFFRR_000718 [Megaselia abdita]
MASNTYRSFGFSNNGEIEFIQLTKDYVEDAVDMLYRSFFLNESVSKASEIDLPGNPSSIKGREELAELCRVAAKDGVSVVAKHVPTDKIVSVAFNKVQVSSILLIFIFVLISYMQQLNPSGGKTFFEQFRDDSCTSPNAKNLMNYMINMNKMCNVFTKHSIDCVIELMFLATLPEFGKKGIAYDCSRYTIELAKELSKGIGMENISTEFQGKFPKGVAALWTSTFSAKIGKKLGFEVLNTVPYTEFSFNGKTYDQSIGPVHPKSEQVFLLFK